MYLIHFSNDSWQWSLSKLRIESIFFYLIIDFSEKKSIDNIILNAETLYAFLQRSETGQE